MTGFRTETESFAAVVVGDNGCISPLFEPFRVFHVYVRRRMAFFEERDR